MTILNNPSGKGMVIESLPITQQTEVGCVSITGSKEKGKYLANIYSETPPPQAL